MDNLRITKLINGVLIDVNTGKELMKTVGGLIEITKEECSNEDIKYEENNKCN